MPKGLKSGPQRGARGGIRVARDPRSKPRHVRAYPGIERAALLIALDNGGINRDRSVEQQKRDLYKFLAKQPDEMLSVIDQWLAGLTDEQLEAACCGETSEMEAMLATSPPFTDRLLNDYFDEVC